MWHELCWVLQELHQKPRRNISGGKRYMGSQKPYWNPPQILKPQTNMAVTRVKNFHGYLKFCVPIGNPNQ